VSHDVAYVILAHKLPQQLARLARALDPEASPVLVHVDGRTDRATFAAMEAALDGLPNTHLLPRHRSRWAGWGVVAATLEGIAAVVERDLPGDHVVLITGQDYPVKPAAFIRDHLGVYPGESFLLQDALPKPEWGASGGLERLERWWFHVAGRHGSLPLRRRLPSGLRPHGGFANWALARPAVEYVHAEVRARPELVSFFRHAAAPDELFFHTILMSGPLAPTVRNDALRYYDCPPGRTGSRTLTMEDLPMLAALPPNGLWARKFDETVDAAVLDAIDAMNAG
jgi:Core-2/I-Branching enzyme